MMLSMLNSYRHADKLVVALLFSSILIWAFSANQRRKRAALPPGPTPIPLIGNIFDFPRKELWLTLSNWAQKYGEVCYANVLGQSIVVVSSADAAVELLDKRGAIYSDKPKLVMVGELCGCENMIPFLPYDDCFRRRRKFMQLTLGPRSIPEYHPLIEVETRSFLRDILSSPLGYLRHTRKYAGGLTLSVIYGYQAKSDDDKYLRFAEECLNILSNEIASEGGIWLVDVFPFLRYLPSWMPGAKFKRDAKIWKAKIQEFVEMPFQWSKSNLGQKDSSGPSFCSTFMSDGQVLTAREEEDIKWTANSMFAASAETTITTVSQFFLAMLLYPDALRKAQQEMDVVLGGDRLPTFADRASLPFTEAILSETWRWGVPVPVNLPHSLRQDDIYNGKFIPKGSFVLANIWSILRDETTYPNADKFIPERFLDEKDPEKLRKMDPRHYVFGFGRRRCPGADLVESSIWLLLASMIAALDISKAVNEDGKPIDPVVKFNDATFRTPDHFPFGIKARNKRMEDLIMKDLL
jgi:cytochrome P450